MILFLFSALLGAPQVVEKRDNSWTQYVLAREIPGYEIKGGSGILQRNKINYSAKQGIYLYEGYVLQVPNEMRFLGQFGAFFVISRRGTLDLALLRNEGCGIRDLIIYTGWISVNPRPFTCPTSTLQVVSAKTGATFTFTGTKATIFDKEELSALAVQHGSVEVSNTFGRVQINGGYGSLTSSRAAPGAPIKLDPDLSITLKTNRLPWGTEVEIKTNPLNTITVEGSDEVGQGRFLVRYPAGGNATKVTVRSPFDTERVYVLPRIERKL